jgi:hypothetical protein
MTASLQREHWSRRPTYLSDLFHVTKVRGGKTLSAVCRLWTHHLAWEGFSFDGTTVRDGERQARSAFAGVNPIATPGQSPCGRTRPCACGSAVARFAAT